MTNTTPTGLETEDVITIPKKVWDASQQRDRSQRRLLAAALAVIFVAVGMLGYRTLWIDPPVRRQATAERRRTSEKVDSAIAKIGDLQVVVDAVRSYTDPEAQKARDAALAGAVMTVDCKNRDALQQLADALAERGTATRITLTCAR